MRLAMLVDKLLKRRPSRHAFLSAGAPILGLVLLVIAGAFVVFINFAHQQDRSYVDNSRRLVANTLNGRLRALSDVTLDYANWTDAYNAVSVHWNGAWVAANFYSTVTDGMVIFRRDGTVRYVWKAESLEADSTALAFQIVAAARDIPALASLARAPHATGTVTRTLAVINGHLALLSVAAIEPEDDSVRLQRPLSAPVDYIAAVDILDAAQIAALGSELNLHDFAVSQREDTDNDLVSLPLRAANEAVLGHAQWRNQRPGSVAFAGEIGPVLLGLLVIGMLSFLVARILMMREVAAATQVEAALESSRLKSEFISNMSHELRTPLDAIIGYTELIDEEAPKGAAFDPLRRDAGRIAESAAQLRQLIDDVLDHSRIDAGRLHLAPEPINVSELFAEIEDVLEPSLRAQANRLTFVCDNARLSLVSDHQRLRQCLINLAENSLKFTRNGEIAISARSALVEDIDCVVFEVKDNGLGITRAAAATLFEPFTQPAAGVMRPKRGGTLSLSISRKLARAMGGDITFEGDPNGGAHFTLWLPANSRALVANAA
jgi:signal transduction histidine kinase